MCPTELGDLADFYEDFKEEDCGQESELSVSASKEGVVHNRSFFVILTTDSFEALFISYFKPAGIW